MTETLRRLHEKIETSRHKELYKKTRLRDPFGVTHNLHIVKKHFPYFFLVKQVVLLLIALLRRGGKIEGDLLTGLNYFLCYGFSTFSLFYFLFFFFFFLVCFFIILENKISNLFNTLQFDTVIGIRL